MFLLFDALQASILEICMKAENDSPSKRSESSKLQFTERTARVVSLIAAGQADEVISIHVSKHIHAQFFAHMCTYICSGKIATGTVERLLSFSALDIMEAIDKDKHAEEEASGASEDSVSSDSDSDDDDDSDEEDEDPADYGEGDEGSGGDDDEVELVATSGGQHRRQATLPRKRKSTKLAHTALAVGWAKSIVRKHYVRKSMASFVGAQPALMIFGITKIPTLNSLLKLLSESS